jgi:hypothetical protein
MSKKLTTKEVDGRLLKLGKNVIMMDEYLGNSQIPIRFCHDNEGCNYHEWKTTANIILSQNTGCPKCAGRPKLTTKEINRRLFNIGNGIIMKGEYPGGQKSSTSFIHDCEECDYYEWETTTSSVVDGKHGCPKCAKNARLSNLEIDRRLRGRDIIRLGDYSGFVHSPIEWLHDCEECNYHVWFASPGSILNQETGCPVCARAHNHDSQRFSNEIIDAMIIGSNIIRFDDYPGNCLTPIRWLHDCEDCDYNIWTTSTASLLQNKRNCPKCYFDSQRLTDNIIQTRLLGTGIIMMDDYSGDIMKPTRFLHDNEGCNYYEWKVPVNNIINCKTSCPKCCWFKNEKLVGNLLEIYNISFRRHVNVMPNITNKRRGIFIDFYLSDINIIIEYNGAQHYQPVCFGGMNDDKAEKQFYSQQERDRKLQKYCNDNNITLIWIDGRKYRGQKLEKYIRENIIPLLQTKLTG